MELVSKTFINAHVFDLTQSNVIPVIPFNTSYILKITDGYIQIFSDTMIAHQTIELETLLDKYVDINFAVFIVNEDELLILSIETILPTLNKAELFIGVLVVISNSTSIEKLKSTHCNILAAFNTTFVCGDMQEAHACIKPLCEVNTKPSLIGVDLADVLDAMSPVGNISVVARVNATSAIELGHKVNCALNTLSLNYSDIVMPSPDGILFILNGGNNIDLQHYSSVGDAFDRWCSADTTIVVGAVIDPNSLDDSIEVVIFIMRL